jgi:hypothetical protein
MRKRTTWSSAKPHQATTMRKADPYQMNQEHPQPSPVEYENGDPSSWAEDLAPNAHVEKEYEGGAVKRNEVGFPEFRDDTWDHKNTDKWGRDSKGKYDNQRNASERKASAVEKLARAVLSSSNDKLIEDQIVDFMSIPNQTLVSTLKRMKASSPESLEPKQRYNRAMACAKLSAQMLGDDASPGSVEKLGRAFFAANDSILKGIIQAASARVAEDQPEELAKPEVATDSEESEVATDSEESEVAMVEEMLNEELGAPPAPMAPVRAAPAAPVVDELQALFQPPSAEAPHVSIPLAAASKGDIDISFDDGEETHTASQLPGDDMLDRLFSDHPEVQAQREISSASKAQTAAEFGFPVEARTASANSAKKIGQVKPTPGPSHDKLLEQLWERP